jgi:triosephosphate isomerase
MTLNRLVAGNWKMHGISSDLEEIMEIARQSRDYPGVDVALCLPAILIERASRAVPRFPDRRSGRPPGGVWRAHRLRFGANAVRRRGKPGHRRPFRAPRGAAGKRFRGPGQGRGRLVVRPWSHPVRRRKRGNPRRGTSGAKRSPRSSTNRFPGAPGDPAKLAIAYEPIWAIGTGKVPTAAEIGEMHAALRERLLATFGDTGALVRILYGGSVKAGNAPEIFAIPDVGGALVGGASLKAADFIPIVACRSG